jgi:hypothetical protein
MDHAPKYRPTQAKERRGSCEIANGAQDGRTQQPGAGDLAATVKRNALIGMTRLECANYIGMSLYDFSLRSDLVSAYAAGWNEHTEQILKQLFYKATIDGDMKALVYLAEKHLGRGAEQPEDRSLEALKHLTKLSPEERRARIVELTKKLNVAS